MLISGPGPDGCAKTRARDNVSPMVVIAAIPRTLRRFIVFFEFNNQGLFADFGAAKTPRLSFSATAFNTYLEDPRCPLWVIRTWSNVCSVARNSAMSGPNCATKNPNAPAAIRLSRTEIRQLDREYGRHFCMAFGGQCHHV